MIAGTFDSILIGSPQAFPFPQWNSTNVSPRNRADRARPGLCLRCRELLADFDLVKFAKLVPTETQAMETHDALREFFKGALA